MYAQIRKINLIRFCLLMYSFFFMYWFAQKILNFDSIPVNKANIYSLTSWSLHFLESGGNKTNSPILQIFGCTLFFMGYKINLMGHKPFCDCLTSKLELNEELDFILPDLNVLFHQTIVSFLCMCEGMNQCKTFLIVSFKSLKYTEIFKIQK